MAISVADNFSYKGTKPLDARTKYDSVADMKNATTSDLYDGCLAYVVATKKNYQYDSSNEVDPDTGKWRELETGGGGTTYTAGDGIDITNDVISTDNMPDTDMEEIITPLPSVMSRRFKYSTTEQVVGEWIDGKPIYQKTIDCGGLPNKSTKDVSIGVTDLKFIIEVNCVAKSTSISGGRLLPIPFARTDTCSQQIMIMFTDTSTTTPKIHISTSGYDYSGYTETYCTILYTKTTD